jgi:GNAT superfamily N-acetyltransferase
MAFITEALGKQHDKAGFHCGEASLDKYIQHHASQDQKRRIAKVFVLIDPENPDVILGYYSLSAAGIEHEGLPVEQGRRLTRYPIPVALLGRLAVSKTRQGQGIGRLLVADALKRVTAIGEAIAVYALVVDAIDETAAGFYRHFGFLALSTPPNRLFLPLATLDDNNPGNRR